MQSFIILDQPSGYVYRIEASSYFDAMEKYVGSLNVIIQEEEEFKEKEKDLYNQFVKDGLL